MPHRYGLVVAPLEDLYKLLKNSKYIRWVFKGLAFAAPFGTRGLNGRWLAEQSACPAAAREALGCTAAAHRGSPGHALVLPFAPAVIADGWTSGAC